MRANLLLLLLWFASTDASLFTSSNPYIASSLVTLFTNTSSIDNTPAIGNSLQTYDHNIVVTNATVPDASGVSGILYDRQQSCQQNVTTYHPELLTNQPKIALVRQGGCSLTDKALYSQLDNAVAVIVYATVPFDVVTGVNNPSVGDNIKIPTYYIDLELGQKLLQLLQQPEPISQAPNNVSYQIATKVTLYPVIGGFPTTWEYILIIVVALLALSFLVSMGVHWHLWRIRRRQRALYENGLSMATLPQQHTDKGLIDPASLAIFPTRIIGETMENMDDDSTKPTVLQRRQSVLSIRHERALENAEALAATIVHPRRGSNVENTSDTSSVSSPHPTAREQTEEVCVICLDDFALGESVRKLPCGHEYHCECIDPWLTIKSASCPLCKHDCSMDVPPKNDDEQISPPPAATMDDSSSRASSIFSLSFLRRRMDDDTTVHQRSAPSTFGPTIPADQAEAFSRTWMARSLPRNMRRQIDLAAQQAAEAHRQEHTVVTLPARMISQPDPSSVCLEIVQSPLQQQQAESSSSTNKTS
ncbi:uncharacterized protein BX664DRAFT_339444 [Halteromyces radiatus]|uniref:uncharacterized protein n=1 Tax=Halteromyces radiatus TaxID=101107 RepID=UPI002220A705|nr:uncharacterized protein BX664DRAFT_339444 [Halteromyces radiatus]KAI8082939.1 hypothetical protein BX664DRAFT_339444 [Halteromyces radiatus]